MLTQPDSAIAVDASAIAPRNRFERLYREHFRFVWMAARSQGVRPGDLEDVVQEVFLVVVRRLGEFEGRSSERTWLYGIVRRVASRYHRTRARGERRSSALRDQPTPAAGESEVAARYLTHRLDEFLERLAPAQREVFVLAEFEQMRGSEIARTLGINQNTVYSRLRSARSEFATRFALDSAAACHVFAREPDDGAKDRIACVVLPLCGTVGPADGSASWSTMLAKAAAIVAVAGSVVAVLAVGTSTPAAVIATRSLASTPYADLGIEPAAVSPVVPLFRAPAPDAPVAPVIVGEIAKPAVATSPATHRDPGPRAVAPRRSVSAAQSSVVPAAPSITDEIAGFKAARAALRDRDYDRALALLRAHALRFPAGTFRAERGASFVEVYCALGRESQARREARELVRSAPTNLAVLDRVRRSCAGTALAEIARAPDRAPAEPG